MRIGISTASLYPMETEKALEYLGGNGVPATEIFFNSPSELKLSFIKELDRIRKHYGIDIVSLHPCGSVGEPYFLFSGYERRYKDSFEYYKNYYRAAEILGARTVVLHGDSLAGHIPMDEYCERLLSMNAAAYEYGTTVCQENVNRYRAATPENVKEMRRLTNDKIKFTFDVKQAVRDGCGVEKMYEVMRGNIINVHISDHSDKGDCLLPQNGDFDFGWLFDKLKSDGYNGDCLIEVYNYAYKSSQELMDSYKIMKNIHKIH